MVKGVAVGALLVLVLLQAAATKAANTARVIFAEFIS